MCDSHDTGPETQAAIRTLVAAGFTIERSRRHPCFIEVYCRKKDVMGADVPYLIGFADEDEVPEAEVREFYRTAEGSNRIGVLVTPGLTEHSVSWRDFTEAHGGAVPSWEALSDDFHDMLTQTSRNQLPGGVGGEAWMVFEDLVASGLEFCTGRRARRLGGRVRGRRVSDVIAQLPSRATVVVDAKASSDPFTVDTGTTRALIEYTERQRQRQQGHLDVAATLVVSSRFQADPNRLRDVSMSFNTEAGVPLAFMESECLSEAVRVLADRPDVRNGIRWTRLLRGGLVEFSELENEVAAVDDERIRGGD